MHIVICDDEQTFAENLQSNIKKELSKYKTEYIITILNSGDTLVSMCKKTKIDVVFLDISMPGFNGFDAAASLRAVSHNIIIIFVSSKEETVFSSYEYSPMWFIPKTQLNLLERVVEKIVTKVQESEKERRFVSIKVGNEVIEIDITQVLYFKTEGHYIHYKNIDGKISKSFRCKMDDIERQLAKIWFVRTHNRFLLNLKFARMIKGNDFICNNDEAIPISRANMNQTKEKFQDYLRSIR